MNIATAASATNRNLRSFHSLIHSFSKYYDKHTAQLKRRVRKFPRPYMTVVFVLIPSLLYVVRAWQYIVNPQLNAEDGVVWLADAYNKGAKTLFIPYNQFFHSAERIFALIVVHLPLSIAPFLFNICGFGIFVLLCYYLFSSRSRILTTNFQRLFLALCLGLVANFTQLYFNFTNSVMLLGIIGILIYLAVPSRSKAIRILEKMGFIVICLTFPFAWFYLPILLFDRLRLRRKNTFYIITALIASVAQLYAYEFTASHRFTVPISMLLSSKYVLIEIFNQMITPALFFTRFNYNLAVQAHDFLPILITCTLILFFSLFIIIKHASLEFKYFVIFLTTFTFATLKGSIPRGGSPVVGINILKVMAITPDESRYFVYGILCLFLIIALAVSIYFKRRAAYIFLVLFTASALWLSIAGNAFIIHKNGFVDYSKSYSKGISVLNESRRTKTVIIPENPIGWWWLIVLNAKK
jgi:hypothetical protein